MRCLLVNPFYPISETPSPPLGLAFVAAALERAGVEVRILDLVVTPYSPARLRSLMEEFEPDIVGSTSVTMNVVKAAEVIRDAKRVDPEILTVMGGPHVTFSARETLEELPELDVVVLGEGEETVVEIAEAWKERRDLARVAGITFRGPDGIVAEGLKRRPIDVDTLPLPARHLVPLGRYRALSLPLTMTTSRGCPHTCIFCVGRKMVGPKVRYRDPIKVVDEMEYLTGLGFRQINVADDLFTAKESHCLAVCDEILRRGLQVKWTSFSRVDTVSRRMLDRMREAGCYMIAFGVESGNPEILKTIQKRITPEQVIEAVKFCNEAGITPAASFILGLPGETPETMRQTIEFGETLKAMGTSHGFHLLAPFPGTAVREESERFGIKILTDDWSQYHANRAIVETPSVTKEDLEGAVAAWDKELVEWLGYIREQYEKGEATEEEAWPILNLDRTVALYDLMVGGAIEEKGSWPTEGRPVSEDEALRGLAERVDGATRYPKDQILAALRYAAERDNLVCVRENGHIRWQWVDDL